MTSIVTAPPTSPAAPINPSTALSAGRAWLEEHSLDARLYPHTGVDGLAAGAIMTRRVPEEVSFVDPYDRALDTTGPVIVVDRGVKPVQTRAPILYVDRHVDPEAVRGTVVWDDHVPATSVLAWRLIGSPADALWLAALGVLSQGGETGLEASKIWNGPTVPLRRLGVLATAAATLRHGPLHSAFRLFAESPSPAEALSHPAIPQLEGARRRLEQICQAAVQVAPRVHSQVAIAEIDAPAHIEDRLVRAWARQLAPLPVIVANRGWQTNRVSLAASAEDGRDLSPWLNRIYTTRPGWTPASGGSGNAVAVMNPLAYEGFTNALERAARATRRRVSPAQS